MIITSVKRIPKYAFLSCDGFGLTVVGASTYGRIDFLPSLGHDYDRNSFEGVKFGLRLWYGRPSWI